MTDFWINYYPVFHRRFSFTLARLQQLITTSDEQGISWHVDGPLQLMLITEYIEEYQSFQIKYAALWVPSASPIQDRVPTEGGYTVTVPALPGCVTCGETLDQAIEIAKEAIQFYLESLASHGEQIPLDKDTLVPAESHDLYRSPAASDTGKVGIIRFRIQGS